MTSVSRHASLGLRVLLRAKPKVALRPLQLIMGTAGSALTPYQGPLVNLREVAFLSEPVSPFDLIRLEPSLGTLAGTARYLCGSQARAGIVPELSS